MRRLIRWWNLRRYRKREPEPLLEAWKRGAEKAAERYAEGIRRG